MKITVELSDSELHEVCQATGERKKGPAIRKLVVDALQLKRRAAVAQNFISGKWGTQLRGYEGARETDKRKSKAAGKRWRGEKA